MQTNTNINTTRENTESRDASVAKLQECLRSELSAAETYELALKSVSHVGLHRTLQEILVSHSRRTTLLREKIAGLGAKSRPTRGSGAPSPRSSSSAPISSVIAWASPPSKRARIAGSSSIPRTSASATRGRASSSTPSCSPSSAALMISAAH